MSWRSKLKKIFPLADFSIMKNVSLDQIHDKEKSLNRETHFVRNHFSSNSSVRATNQATKRNIAPTMNISQLMSRENH